MVAVNVLATVVIEFLDVFHTSLQELIGFIWYCQTYRQKKDIKHCTKKYNSHFLIVCVVGTV